jgi:sulfur-oxidizing protein SoxY
MKKILMKLIPVLMLVTSMGIASELPRDPLASVQWDDMYDAFLKGHPAVFDDRVIVQAPAYAEDPMNVPVTVDASQISGIKEMVIFADFNPIPLIARYYPVKAKPTLSFRFKIQQASHVRVAVLADDGVWHVGGLWVNSAGGGCTAASTGRLVGDWADYLGEVYGKAWEKADSNRVRFLIHHPMDTGLAPGIPAFYIEELEFETNTGEELASIELYEPINENPVLTFEFQPSNKKSTVIMVGADNNGNEFKASF